MLFIFIAIAGFRFRLGIDTISYLTDFYHKYPTLNLMTSDDWMIGKDPLFVFFISVVKSLDCRFYVFQLVHAAFINILFFIFIRKHSKYVFVCLFFYFILCYTTFNMEVLRASMSIAICLFAHDYIQQKCWLKALLLYLIALFIHVQTIGIILFIPFMLFKFNKIGVIVLLGAYFFGVIFGFTLNDFASIFTQIESIADKVNYYTDSEFGGSIGNLTYRIIYQFPLLFYSLFGMFYFKKIKRSAEVDYVEPFIFCAVFFMLIQLNIQIVYRFVDYFRFHLIILLANLLVSLTRNKKLNLKLSYTRSFVIFIPLFFSIYVTYSLKSYRYFPYSSIFDRSPVRSREIVYNNLTFDSYDQNEY